MYNDEQIVMTPTKRSRDHTTVTMERLKSAEMEQNNVIHIGGGDHKGIVIYKEPPAGKSAAKPPELVLGFKVMLRSSSSNKHEQENWQLKFWFKNVQDQEKIENAESFLTELISCGERPKDSVAFIMKILKLMQLNYPIIKKVEVEMKKHEEIKVTPPSPATSVEAKITNSKLTAEQEKLLDIIEAVYPNSLSVPNIAKSSNISDEEAQEHLIALQARGLVKCLSNGNYMRTTKNDTDVKMVKQMPMVAQSKQPVIAIITAQYCEKLAVDAMIDNKETFVKFKTEGESNVYTLGTIGPHRVVSTKLPATGMARGAMIAAGSTTTRLLGSFPRVDYVFLVGVGGGVPHCYDYTKHVRLGDVVISTPPDNQHSYVYLYCEALKNAFDPADNDFLSPEQISIKTWCPISLKLQNIACNLWRKGILNMSDRSWDSYIEEGLKQLKDKESSFCRPPSDTDKIYCMSVEGGDLVDVGHPQPMEGAFDPRKPGLPVLHFGAVGSGKILMQDDTKRLAFADHHGIMSFDTGFGSVVESIFGNRKDDYVFIRGISDYKDGTKKKEWQPYASLAAASVMKAIICNLDV
ncbi:uncharacterized protein TNIN_484861 [Trichonephila inaurata madagascariensis]|uniref:Winged helix-turn-helix domain-containing protein n=1 Tax=Trichonephila inaurata madagascariensis TaxID=2747483 RepID=A0A8X6YWX8_9ARAC|nr:uncharacterized protein TNIN_484861 [Trichonephila inaurata madagascariensis]